jgi:CheY-like chemotaxis protein
MARVLVVDDSEDALELYALILEAAGHDVARATDGGSGLRLVAEFRPDVVLLDMMMPDVDGLEFLARLPDCRSPLPAVIANSGFNGYCEEALRRGAWSFLAKPMTPDALVEAVAAALEHRPILREALMDADAAAARRASALRSIDLLERLTPEAIAEVRGSLRALVEWMIAYYGFGRATVSLVDATDVCVLAISNGGWPWVEGARIDRTASYCHDIVTTGSTLILNDPVNHPSPYFSRHPEVTAGWRFYAGVPLTTSKGVVLGVLCLVDSQPRELHTEDIQLFQALGRQVAFALEALADGGHVRELIFDEAGDEARLFLPAMLPILLRTGVQRAARSGGTIGLALLDVADERCGERAAACYRAAPVPGLAIARHGRSAIAAVQIGNGESARGGLRAAIAACCNVGGVKAVGVAWRRMQAGSHEFVEAHADELDTELLRAAEECRDESLRRSGAELTADLGC